jgi:hypothetical protein
MPDRVKRFFQHACVNLEAEEEGGVEKEGAEEDADTEEFSEVESVVGGKHVKPEKDWGFYIKLP